MKNYAVTKNHLVLLILFFLSACNSVNPVWGTFKAATGFGDGNSAPLTPGVEYLRVNVNGHQAMMALGYRTFPKTNDKDTASNAIDVEALVRNSKQYSPDEYIHEYWYSGQKEMIELVDGRIVSVMGMTTEWRQSTTRAPRWDMVDSPNLPNAWVRIRDLMPGYRYGFKDNVLTRLVDTPIKNNDVPIGATWYKDDITSKNLDGSSWSYSQIFARINGKVVYSEQCISSDLCLTMKYIGTIAKK